MHDNSLEAYRAGILKGFKTKSQKVFEMYHFFGPYTDRQVLNAIDPFSDDLNAVRPRISELIKHGILEECGSKKESGRTVRLCRVAEKQKEQRDLFEKETI